MRTKNAKAITNKERAHLGRVKELPCSVCDAPAPSEAHHVKQGQQYTAVALCVDCHRGAWHIKKMDELLALNVTIMRLTQQ